MVSIMTLDSYCSLYQIYSQLFAGTPCDVDVDDLEPGSPPPPWDDHADDDYSPFRSCTEFQLTELLYAQEEMSASPRCPAMQSPASAWSKRS